MKITKVYPQPLTPAIVVRTRYEIVIATAILVFLSIFQGVSADRSDATEHNRIIDEEDYEVHWLLTEMGEPVEIWIDSISGVNGSEAHSIDLYLTTDDEYWDHFCGGEGNPFAEEFSPLYVKEKLQISELPFHFTYTPTSDDGLWFFLDNCNNQRDSDWGSEAGESVDSVQVVYAIDDQTDELAEDIATGILAICGGGVVVFCGVPILLVILIVILLRRRKKEVIVIQQPPNQQGYQMPPSN